MTNSHYTLAAMRRGVRMVGAASLLVVASACQNLLDVKNPNNVAESSLANPAAATPAASGVLASTVRMLSAISVVYGVATDELDWIGSRDAWNELETGAFSNYINEFSDGAFPFVAEARYLADQTVARLEGFRTAGTLATPWDLGRTYLYAGIIYATIADMYDDFAFSNKTTPGKPVGRAAMSGLYDTAIGYLDKALALATTTTDRYNVTAYRARVKHAKGVWQKITPKSSAAPAQPLVNDAGAVADANAAIALGSGDQAFDLVNNLEATAGINIWFEVNGRNESSPGSAYVVDSRHSANKYVAKLADPVSNAPDPRLQARLTAFRNFGTQAGTHWMTSTRELRLILAEAALAAGNTAEFTTQINLVRAMDAKPAFSGQIANTAMLVHERRTQLWLMRRRLADMYRFGQKDAKWASSPTYESAFSSVGMLFPIANVERLANPCIANPAACK